MSSTFNGLEIAKSGLVSSQIAQNITGNNISNVNTDGYTRQGVDQSSISSTSGVSRYASTSVKSGKGVSVNSIAQYRDEFLDLRYRNANATYNTYSTSLSALQSIESIVDETENDGLIVSFQDYYTALEDLGNNTGDVEYASLARSAAKTVAAMFNQYAEQLKETREGLEYDLSLTISNINTYIEKIRALNTNIKISIVNGTDYNELADERNAYFDELSSYMDIKVEENNDGTISVLCGSEYLLDAQNDTATTLSVDTSTDTVKVVDGGGNEFAISEGSVKGILQSLNGLGSYAGIGEDSYYGLAYYEKALDDLAFSFGDTYNNLNSANGDLFESSDSGNITAATISVSEDWFNNAEHIDTDRITDMIGALEDDNAISSAFTGSFEEFATELMSEMAVDVSYIKDMSNTYKAIAGTIQDERESISGVSTDEETVNMMKYQKAYQASARIMTVLDEMLDKLINDTGVVGR